MGLWSAVTIYAYSRATARRWPLLTADFLVTAACLLASLWVEGATLLSHSSPTLTIVWMVCPALAVSVAYGRGWGAAAALGIGMCDLAVRGPLNQATVTGTIVMIISTVATGHLARLGRQVQERLREVAELEAATRERERFARRIHDSVLQVLALVQRRGTEIGGEAAELGRLAGEQEVVLRAMVHPMPAQDVHTGWIDLRSALSALASLNVSLAGPETEVWLPARIAGELAVAVKSALDNVRRHAGPDARAWILVEDEPAAVRVTVRDDGPGIPAGRLEEAAAQGRLGIAQSIQGRLRDLGGAAILTSIAGQGTEIALELPKAGIAPAAELSKRR
jgi:signal transduction histidine kinase